ncbi:MAG: hypothetical protein A2Z20_08055 [Bdellovibrionales bacterium RBG_16_40_8]|nr:MAG: hypothetical protein A2Z20_08055 [Bdellovibrionales bacterium RBG_16_40_8]
MRPTFLNKSNYIVIDDKKAHFILTDSSVRKLRKQSELNLLPGRVISMRMDALSHTEFAQPLEHHLYFGSQQAISRPKPITKWFSIQENLILALK